MEISSQNKLNFVCALFFSYFVFVNLNEKSQELCVFLEIPREILLSHTESTERITAELIAHIKHLQHLKHSKRIRLLFKCDSQCCSKKATKSSQLMCYNISSQITGLSD